MMYIKCENIAHTHTYTQTHTHTRTHTHTHKQTHMTYDIFRLKKISENRLQRLSNLINVFRSDLTV